MNTELHYAWLAGFLDGEGSVGMTKSRMTLIPTLQVSHTDKESIEEILRLIYPLIGQVPCYQYLEKNPLIHRDAHILHVTGMARIRIISQKIMQYSVTKRKHWLLLSEFMDIRSAIAGFDDKGNIKRGGPNRQPYGEREWAIYEELKALNRRGQRIHQGKAVYKGGD